MSELVFHAFKAIGPPGPGHRREIALIAKAIRESGDEEALALFGASRGPDPDPEYDSDAYHRVLEVAERAGKGWHDALDLYTAAANPGWAPFGGRAYLEEAA